MEGPLHQAERQLALDLPAAKESVTEARRSAAVLAEALGGDRPAVELAVGEAVGNAVLHAYRDGSDGRIDVSGGVEDGQLVITVTDRGVGMRPDPASTGLGFGLPLIAQAGRGHRAR